MVSHAQAATTSGYDQKNHLQYSWKSTPGKTKTDATFGTTSDISSEITVKFTKNTTNSVKRRIRDKFFVLNCQYVDKNKMLGGIASSGYKLSAKSRSFVLFSVAEPNPTPAKPTKAKCVLKTYKTSPQSLQEKPLLQSKVSLS